MKANAEPAKLTVAKTAGFCFGVSRAIAPLKQSDDAILVDTTEIDFDQSLELLLNTIRERI